MIFGKSDKQLETSMEVMIDSVKLERVYVNTFLGVMFDHSLSWKPHVKHVRAKLSHIIGI